MKNGLASLIPIRYEGDKNLLEQFNIDFEKEDKLFYPSSGDDITDLIYVNNIHLADLIVVIPRIFIHSDASNYFDDYCLSNFERRFPFQIKGKLQLFYQNNKQINIICYNHPNNTLPSWIMYFSGFTNEELIKMLFEDKTQIKSVYSNTCDGITNGMGCGFEGAVSTIFYPFLYSKLGIKYHITEFNANKITIYLKNYCEATWVRTNLQNLLLLDYNSELEKMLALNDEQLVDELIKVLTKHKEVALNVDSKLRIMDNFMRYDVSDFIIRYIQTSLK